MIYVNYMAFEQNQANMKLFDLKAQFQKHRHHISTLTFTQTIGHCNKLSFFVPCDLKESVQAWLWIVTVNQNVARYTSTCDYSLQY